MCDGSGSKWCRPGSDVIRCAPPVMVAGGAFYVKGRKGMTDEQLKQYRDASNRLRDPDCGEMEAMNLAMWLGERAHIMLDQIEELVGENERLLGVIADPELLGIKIDERCVEISARPREEIMRHLFVMMAHGLGDSPNFVECTFGPDPKTGKSYVLELRHYHGKTPGQAHAEQVEKLEKEIEELKKVHPNEQRLIRIAQRWLAGGKIEKQELTDAFSWFLESFKTIPEPEVKP